MPTDTPTKRRPRFSLLNLVLLMTIVAAGVGLYRSKLRNSQLAERNALLEAENREHRNQLGLFEIEDPLMVHAIRMPTARNEPRKYRLYIPEGRPYFLHYNVLQIPAAGIMKSRHSIELEPGENVISIKFERSVDSSTAEPNGFGLFGVRVASQGGRNGVRTHRIGVREQNTDWIVNRETGQTSFGWQEIGRQVELSSPDDPLVLYRARAEVTVVGSRDKSGKPKSWTSKSIEGPCEGFLVWISTEEEHP